MAMIAFAANPIFCRKALKDTGIDVASFTSIRLVSGAVALSAITIFFRRHQTGSGNWLPGGAGLSYKVPYNVQEPDYWQKTKQQSGFSI